jgi:cobalt/nickel transport protein
MRKIFVLGWIFVLLISGTASAHFGMVIPSRATVMNSEDAAVSLRLSFSHPMEMQGMPLIKPKSFQVYQDGKAADLLADLKPIKVLEQDAWNVQYTLKRPGVYQFVMEPEPYWEPAEDCFIQHYTKTYVAAFGEEEGWDQPLGLKTEIVPLTRPFGNYAGNIFQGQVLLSGKPVPGAEVEVEYYNKDNTYVAPDAYFVTQAVKADGNGVFTFVAPFAGWWGFAALSTLPDRMSYQGIPKDLELGAVLWLEFVNPILKK